MAKTLCKVVGLVLLIAGIGGFFSPNLMGMHLTNVHNIVHIASGALALYFGFLGSAGGARGFCLLFGLVYALLGVIGFIQPGLVASVLQAHEEAGAASPTMAMDSIVHLLVGAVFLVAGLLSPKTAS